MFMMEAFAHLVSYIHRVSMVLLHFLYTFSKMSLKYWISLYSSYQIPLDFRVRSAFEKAYLQTHALMVQYFHKGELYGLLTQTLHVYRSPFLGVMSMYSSLSLIYSLRINHSTFHLTLLFGGILKSI